MTLLRMKDVNKMDEKERQSKIQELRLSLIRSQVTAHKATAKTKEIKRALARLLTCQGASERTRALSMIKDSKQNKKESSTFNNSHKEGLEKK